MFIEHRQIRCGRHIGLRLILCTGDQQTLHGLFVFCQFRRSTVKRLSPGIPLRQQSFELRHLLFHISDLLQDLIRQIFHCHTVGGHDMGQHLPVNVSKLSGKLRDFLLFSHLTGHDFIVGYNDRLQRLHQHSHTAECSNCQQQ